MVLCVLASRRSGWALRVHQLALPHLPSEPAAGCIRSDRGHGRKDFERWRNFRVARDSAGQNSVRNFVRVCAGAMRRKLYRLQSARTSSMEPMPLDIKLGSALSFERIRVNIPAVFTVAVGSDPKFYQKAAERLLGMPQDEIAYQAKEIITGQLRAVVAQLDIDQIIQDRELFNGMIDAAVATELGALSNHSAMPLSLLVTDVLRRKNRP
jgi:regulator of protease activity HflC (stomatin/prohibitin superfamily)